jgi:hypothetical protein
MIRGARGVGKVLFRAVSCGAVKYNHTVHVAIELKPKLLPLAAFLAALSISTFIVLAVTAQVSPIDRSLQTGEKAYTELKAADAAGANITILSARFNSALDLLQNASNLERTGDNTKASQLAAQANNSFLSIIQDSQSLRDNAISERQHEATFQNASILIGALVVAVVTVVVLTVYRRIQSRQFAELMFRVKERT